MFAWLTRPKKSLSLSLSLSLSQSLSFFYPLQKMSEDLEKMVVIGFEEKVDSNVEENAVPRSRVANFVRKIQIHGSQGLSNADMDPVPLEDQNWKPYHYLAYWLSDSYSASSWRAAGSYIELGLSPVEFYVCDIAGYLINGIIVAVHGVVGARYHIPFSVQSRASFGFYFSYVIVLMRFVVGCYYYGINAYTGAECIQTLILAMSPKFANLKDTMDTNATTTSMMICYVIYNVVCIPFHYIKAQHIKKFLVFKMITGPIVGVVLMIYLNTKAGGAHVIWSQPATVSGTEHSWLIMQCLAVSLSSYATMAVNVNDFTRYASNEYASFVQAYAIPLNQGILAPMGIVGGISSKILYGETLWDPLLIAQKWIHTPGGRTAAFFVALSYLIAQIGINISANSISAANDLTALFPKYVNIRRGQYIVLALGGWALVPWEVLANATTLTAFMGGYSIFLGPIAAIMICDFYLVHKGKYHTWQLYDKNGIYRYGRFGTNWRSIPPFLIGFAPMLPGMASYINPSVYVPQGWLNLYLIGYFYSFLSSFLLYYIICLVFPPSSTLIEEAVKVESQKFEPLTENDYTRSTTWRKFKILVAASITG